MKPYLKQSLFHTGLLLVFCLLFVSFCLKGYYVCAFILFIVLCVDFMAICRFLRRSSKEFENFIWSLRYSEFQTSYRTRHGKKLPIPEELKDSIEAAITHYETNLRNKESSLLYFQTLVNHIDVAVIVYACTGRVEWANLALKRLVGCDRISTLNDLSAFCPELSERLKSLKPGVVSVIPVVSGIESEQLALSGVEFTVQGRTLMICSLKNIRSVLESKTVESWEKLIRVITHEIMNSITPIISLSELLTKQLERGADEVSSEEIGQIVRTIHNRSEGVLQFAENYRRMARIPMPEMQTVSVVDLLANISRFMTSRSWDIEVEQNPENLVIWADRGQIEQVLINLVKNGIEAGDVGVRPHIRLTSGCHDNGGVYIAVSDNGLGMTSDLMEHIFVPFFTTKSKGSGIGLSVSYQIMLRHHGHITFNSQPGTGSTFILHFSAV